MKHTKKKKLLAFVLCMVLVLSTAITAFAVDGNFYYVPKDTVELSHEIMKDGASQGTLYATVPGGAFKSSTDNAELQMDMQEETSESTVLEAVQTELENTGNTGYTVHQAVMGDVSFRISTEDKAQIPEKAVNFRFENTSLDTAHAMGFVYDSSDETITLYELKEDTLQFEEDVKLETETVVVGCFDVVEKETEEAQPEDEDESVQTVDVSASGYSLTTSATNGVDITVQHYLKDGIVPLYKESKVHLSNDQKIENLSSLTNYEAVKVVEVNDGEASSDPIRGNIVLTTDKTYRVYYQETTETITKRPVQMFDYTINGKNKGINSSENYGNNIPTTSRLASGTIGDGCNDYDTNISVSGKSPYYINAWDRDSKGNPVNRDSGHTYGSNTGGTAFAAKGIITGIDYDSGALKMGKTSDNAQLYEPGYFTREAKEGKSIYPDRYKLTFNRNGDNYTLYDVTNTEGTTSKLSNYDRTTGANFFPLDDLGTDKDNKNTAASDGKKHNDYFGMRYDVQFTLGGYLGDLNYHFKGDDDLWVVLDEEKNGGQVVLDIGGIHAAIEDSVDLWQILLKKTDYTLQDKIEYLEADADKNGIKNKDENHTLTILYMERGANDSNCKMDFTLPNSTVIDTSRLETSSLKLTKVNTSGNVISGAKFSVTNDSDQNDTRTVTSGTDGKLTFTGLQQGSIYTLSEVSVPSPYVRTTTIWKVKLEGSPLRAVLYDSTGTVQQTLDTTDSTYHIVNSTQEDIVSQSVESDKTVSVKDYNARTYQVDLTASSKATQTVTKTTPYDIVMVLDTSGSMKRDFYQYTEYKGNLNTSNAYYIQTEGKIYQTIKYKKSYGGWYYYKDSSRVVVDVSNTTVYTRTKDTNASNKLAGLQQAAKAFVTNIKEKSPDSRISIVTFDSDSEIKSYNKKYMLRVGDSLDVINNTWIGKLSAGGATRSDRGLEDAKNVFESDVSKWASVEQNDNRKRMVVFLTGGVPTSGSTYSPTVAKYAKENATTIKETYKADIYSLGIFDAAAVNGYIQTSSEENAATISQISSFMKAIASDDSKYMTADSVSNLYSIFDSISKDMDVSVTATITDVIDSRFELTDKQKDTFAKRSDVRVTYNDDGTTIVTWIDTTVNSKTGNTPGWHETIEIKAKDDFIGGNMIPTNGPDSGITVGNNKKSFPQPSVNVKLLTPSIGDKEITYYKGDTIESSKFSGELLGTYKMTELNGETTVGIPQLTKDQLAELEKGGTVEVPYSYTKSSADVVGKFVYAYRNTKYEAEDTKVNSLENHTATKVGQDVEEYKLAVTFVPKTVAERKDLLKDTAVLEPDANTSISGTIVTDASVTGTYKVHVLALWAIVKQSTSADSAGNHPMLSGAKFELLKDSKVCYTGESNSDGFVEWYKGEKKVSLSEIVKDTYTLREASAPAGYAKSEVQWTIEITDTSVTIKGANGNKISAISLTNNTTGKTYDAYVYKNTPVYALPSTGGTGIFLYMIGGMLLMGAAAWILYKNKRREVLKR